MADIIEFKTKKIDNYNKKLIELFEKCEKKIKQTLNSKKIDVDNKFNELYEKFQKIYTKVQNGNWLKGKEAEKFLNNFDMVTSDEYLYNETSMIMEYIYSVTASQGEILKNDNEYIKLMISSICTMNEINLNSYKKLIEFLSNKNIYNIIKKYETNLRKQHELIDIIDAYLEGYGIQYIINCNENKVEYEEPENIFESIDTIHKYFSEQGLIFEIFSLPHDSFDSIDRILLINRFNKINQNKFIELAKYINDINDFGLIDKLNKLADLTETFLYFDDESLNMLTIEQLKKLVAFYHFSDGTMEDVLKESIFEDYFPKTDERKLK